MSLYNVMFLLRKGTPLAVEIPALDPAMRAWVGVYPLRVPRDQTMLTARGWKLPDGERGYRVRVFEVRRELIDADVWLAEPDLKNRLDCFGVEQDLPRILAEVDVRLTDLKGLWRAKYPI